MLHFPCYWHYDILFGLRVMTEAGSISDRRCDNALDMLEPDRLPDGGFRAVKKYHRVTGRPVFGRSLLRCSRTSRKQMNEIVTAHDLYVLKACAGRRWTVFSTA